MIPGSRNRTLDADGLLVEAPDAIFTLTGGTIRPLFPDPVDIRIEDIAGALAKQCRFTGHTQKFSSVAEHCVRVSLIVPSAFALEGLLHDASEAYLSDIARPIKRHEDFAFYAEVEKRLEIAIAVRFGLPPRKEMPERIKWADQYTLEAEVAFLHHANFQKRMNVTPELDASGHRWVDEAIPRGWDPALAASMFIHRFGQLGGAS